MPKWLVKQLTQAFMAKDRRQVNFLTNCWLASQNHPEANSSPDKKQTRCARNHI